MCYSVVATRHFRKQFRRVIKQGKDRQKIDGVIERLAWREIMPPNYHVHKLMGEYEGMHELHIEPDLLIIYAYRDSALMLELISIGSHSELFG